MQLRPYQQKIVDGIGRENAIIKMPTGSGKTFVAAEFVLRGIISSKKRQHECDTQTTTAALFLVPTCDLVMQQSRALKHWIGDYEVAEYFGGQSIPSSSFDVLVSTPQAFLVCMSVSCHIYLVMLPKYDLIQLYLLVLKTLQQTEVSSSFSWSNFFAVVFDEVHHVLKDHPYRIIAHGIKKWEKDRSQRIQVIGLSASLTYAVEHKAVKQALANLCHDLSITRMISPSDEELIKSGYIPQDDNIETMKKPWDVPDGVILGE